MKTSIRLAVASVVFLLFFPALTPWSAPRTHEQELSRKAISLAIEACAIYPAMADLDKCVDKIARTILASRGVKPELQSKIIAEQEANMAVRHPPLPGDVMRSPEQLYGRKLGNKVLDIITASCAIEPAITDLDQCMDRAYHSILASRDPHSAYLNKEEFAELSRSMRGDLQGIGAEVAFTPDKAVGVVRVIKGSPAERAGIQDGDRFVAIVNDDERLPTTSFATLNDAVMKIRGKPGTKVTLEILRGEKDEPVVVTAVRAAIRVDMVKTEILVAPDDPSTTYAYVKLIQFGDALRAKMVSAVNDILKRNPDVKGIVFDVRGNLGEVYEAVDVLADSPDALVSIRDNDGIHAYGTAPGERPPEPQPGDITNGLSCAVLTDGHSASASEIFAGALKELGRCVIIGKGTWRKGSVQQIIPSRDGSAIKVTEAEYLIGSPTKWVAVQCVGVEPDIDYEAEVAWKPKKEIHECDLSGAIVSGGARSDPEMIKPPLPERDPALYRFGEQVVEAIKMLDKKAFEKSERIRKLLKLPLPEDEPEEKDK